MMSREFLKRTAITARRPSGRENRSPPARELAPFSTDLPGLMHEQLA